MDHLSPEKRSWNMSRIRGCNTSPEILLRKILHRLGLRYRLYQKKLPGCPDIVFPRYKAVVFVHGCFWHRHGCPATTTPGTNSDFWSKKFSETIIRDSRNLQNLRESGWRIAIVWECSLKGKGANYHQVAETVKKWLESDETELMVP